MTTEELMKPRFKVIANYPLSEYKIGDFLQSSTSNMFNIGLKDEDGVYVWLDEKDILKYPHLFKKLEWWEERNLKDMPKYLRAESNGRIGIAEKWVKQKTNRPEDIYAVVSGFCWFVTGNIPATKEEYENQFEKSANR